MAFIILEPIKHGTRNKFIFLKPGQVVKSSFFTKDQADRLISTKCIEIEDTRPPDKLDNDSEESIPDLPDITELKVSDAKVLLNDETDVTTLHKYLDQEEQSIKPRKGIIDFIHLRIRELTGF